MSQVRQANDQELKQAVKLVFDGVQLGVDLSAGLSAKDLRDLLQVGEDLPTLVSNRAVLWPEYKALDDAARADLQAYVASLAASLPGPVETVVEVLLNTVVALSALFKVFAPSL